MMRHTGGSYARACRTWSGRRGGSWRVGARSAGHSPESDDRSDRREESDLRRRRAHSRPWRWRWRRKSRRRRGRSRSRDGRSARQRPCHTGPGASAAEDSSRSRRGRGRASGSGLFLYRDDGTQHRWRLGDDDGVAGCAGCTRQRAQDAVASAGDAHQLEGAEYFARGHARGSRELRHQHQPPVERRRLDAVIRGSRQCRGTSPGHCGHAVQVQRRHAAGRRG